MCCVALPCCLFDFARFFLPSHHSFKNMYSTSRSVKYLWTNEHANGDTSYNNQLTETGIAESTTPCLVAQSSVVTFLVKEGLGTGVWEWKAMLTDALLIETTQARKIKRKLQAALNRRALRIMRRRHSSIHPQRSEDELSLEEKKQSTQSMLDKVVNVYSYMYMFCVALPCLFV